MFTSKSPVKPFGFNDNIPKASRNPVYLNTKRSICMYCIHPTKADSTQQTPVDSHSATISLAPSLQVPEPVPKYVDETWVSALVSALYRFTNSHALGQPPIIWQDPHRDRTTER